jgi:hypothetical protein
MKPLTLLIICLLLLGCDLRKTAPRALEAFAERYKEANLSQTAEPMLTLYELEGSTENTVNMLRNALLYELGLPIERIDFEPLSGAPEEVIEFEHKGIRYGPTLEPMLRMRVLYATENHFESRFTIGKNSEGEWRIVSSRPVNE